MKVCYIVKVYSTTYNKTLLTSTRRTSYTLYIVRTLTQSINIYKVHPHTLQTIIIQILIDDGDANKHIVYITISKNNTNTNTNIYIHTHTHIYIYIT